MFGTDIGHGDEVAARECALHLILLDRLGHELAEPDERTEQADDDDQRLRGKRCQLAPIVRPQRLRDEFRQHQDRQRHDHWNQQAGNQWIGVEPDLAGLVADPNGANRMRDRVQGQDRGERPIDVLFEALQAAPKPTAFLHFDLCVRRRDAEQHRLPQRTQKRSDNGNKEKQYQQREHGCSIGWLECVPSWSVVAIESTQHRQSVRITGDSQPLICMPACITMSVGEPERLTMGTPTGKSLRHFPGAERFDPRMRCNPVLRRTGQQTTRSPHRLSTCTESPFRSSRWR